LLTAPVLGRSQAHELLELIWKFDEAADARELIRLAVAR